MQLSQQNLQSRVSQGCLLNSQGEHRDWPEMEFEEYDAQLINKVMMISYMGLLW